MNKLATLILFFVPLFSFSQIEINWEILSDVEFTDTYMEEVDEYFLYPYFGANVRSLEGQQVIIRGFVLAIDPADGYYILSKSPYASCFFCGAGGPETVIELKMKSEKDYFMMDEVVTMKGIFTLNSDDIYQCNYILKQAEVHRR
jgi:hypothetical protein